MKRCLIIVEYREEVESLLERYPELLNEQADILSLLPEASVALQEKKIPYRTTSAYFPKSAHEECLLAVDKMIQELNGALSISDNNGITEAYNNTFSFFLRQYISYIVFTIEVISQALKEGKYDVLVAFKYSNNDYSAFRLSAQERILGDILPGFGNEVELKLLPQRIRKRREGQMQAALKPFLNLMFSLGELVKLRSSGKPSVLFYSLHYNLDRIARNLKDYRIFNLMPRRDEYLKFREKKDGFEVHHIHLNNLRPCDPVFKRSLKESLNRMSDLHDTQRVFSFKNHDFGPAVFNKINFGYRALFRDIHRKATSLKTLIRTLRPSIVLSAMSRELSFALGELARQEHIPSVLISHGSHVPPKNDYDRREWLDHGKGLIDTQYQFHLLQSPWARAYVQKMSQQNSYHNIYPIIFEIVDRSAKEEKQLKMFPQSRGKKIMVHASSPKSRQATRFYVYETTDEYIDGIKDLIEATRGNPDVFLIVRFRPSPDLSTEDLIKLLPAADHCTLATHGKFTDYLEIADLLVSFSSTTIEEALINKIPVLQYDRSGRYMHIEGARWQGGGFDKLDSVYWIEEESHLKAATEWIIKNHFQRQSEAIFKRHVFAPHEAKRAEELIEAMARG